MEEVEVKVGILPFIQEIFKILDRLFYKNRGQNGRPYQLPILQI